MPNPTRPRLRPECLEPRDLPAAPFLSLPEVPALDPLTLANARRIAYTGQVEGLRPNAFMKVGDSNTFFTDFLAPLGGPFYNPVLSGLAAFPADLSDTLGVFRAPVDAAGNNSFTRNGFADYPGFLTARMTEEVGVERDQTRAGIALVMAGTNDLMVYGDAGRFRQELGALVDTLTADGVLPVLSTIPRNRFFGASSDNLSAVYNQVVADVADEKHVPLMNLARTLEPLPNSGVRPALEAAPGVFAPDNVHLSVSPDGGGSFQPVDLLYGQNVRNLLVLEVLTELREQVFRFDGPAALTPDGWTPLTAGQAVLAVGSAPGQPSAVTVYDAQTRQVVDRITPYPGDFFGGVATAVGDLNGDGVPDIVTGPSPGGGPLVRAFSGADGHELFGFLAFEPEFRGGVSVAVGDADGDGRNELVVGAGPGGAARVRVLRPADLSVVSDFLAFDPGMRNGANVAVGNFGGSVGPAVAVGAGFGGGPAVGLFDGRTGEERAAFMADDPNQRTGVSVAAGDLNGDGTDELVTGTGAGTVQVFDAATARPKFSFSAGGDGTEAGVRVAVAGAGPFLAVSGGAGLQPVQLFSAAGNPVATLAPPDAAASLGATSVTG